MGQSQRLNGVGVAKVRQSHEFQVAFFVRHAQPWTMEGMGFASGFSTLPTAELLHNLF
jgi:hypothetical protein